MQDIMLDRFTDGEHIYTAAIQSVGKSWNTSWLVPAQMSDIIYVSVSGGALLSVPYGKPNTNYLWLSGVCLLGDYRNTSSHSPISVLALHPTPLPAMFWTTPHDEYFHWINISLMTNSANIILLMVFLSLKSIQISWNLNPRIDASDLWSLN